MHVSLVLLKFKTHYLLSYSTSYQRALQMMPRARIYEEIKGFLYCSINVCHRFMIVSIAISFELIHRGITRFKADC